MAVHSVSESFALQPNIDMLKGNNGYFDLMPIDIELNGPKMLFAEMVEWIGKCTEMGILRTYDQDLFNRSSVFTMLDSLSMARHQGDPNILKHVVL